MKKLFVLLVTLVVAVTALDFSTAEARPRYRCDCEIELAILERRVYVLEQRMGMYDPPPDWGDDGNRDDAEAN